MRLILASTSPRRKELLASTGLEFEVIPSSYEEDMTLPMEPAELVAYLSRGKAQAVSQLHPDAVVIGADTFVVFGNKVMGKPHTTERAKEMLQELSGKVHSLITGVAILRAADAKSVSKVVEIKVYFKALDEKTIDEYISTGEPLDRAGAYAIQGIGKALIEKYEGDFDSAVGLPVKEIIEILKEFE